MGQIYLETGKEEMKDERNERNNRWGENRLLQSVLPTCGIKEHLLSKYDFIIFIYF